MSIPRCRTCFWTHAYRAPSRLARPADERRAFGDIRRQWSGERSAVYGDTERAAHLPGAAISRTDNWIDDSATISHVFETAWADALMRWVETSSVASPLTPHRVRSRRATDGQELRSAPEPGRSTELDRLSRAGGFVDAQNDRQ